MALRINEFRERAHRGNAGKIQQIVDEVPHAVGRCEYAAQDSRGPSSSSEALWSSARIWVKAGNAAQGRPEIVRYGIAEAFQLFIQDLEFHRAFGHLDLEGVVSIRARPARPPGLVTSRIMPSRLPSGILGGPSRRRGKTVPSLRRNCHSRVVGPPALIASKSWINMRRLRRNHDGRGMQADKFFTA